MTDNTEEEIIEDFVAEASSDESGDEMSLQEKVKKLKKELKEEQAKSKEYLDGWQRARADLVNKEKQLQADKLEIYKSANANLIEELIPSLDAYEMAKSNKAVWEAVDAKWRIGVEYIYTGIESALSGNGLVKIQPSSEADFDINKMAAVAEVETSEDDKDHKIESVVQSGYELNGKLLREAKVKIWVKR
jgi:molecular chaperone GrpE